MANLSKEDTFADMRTESNVTHSSSVPANSVAARSRDQLLQEAQEAAMNRGADPLAGRFATEEDVISGRVSLSGNVDPLFGQAGFAIGDRVYHKKRKKEGTVKDIAASGKVQVHLDSGDIGWMNKENLAKL